MTRLAEFIKKILVMERPISAERTIDLVDRVDQVMTGLGFYRSAVAEEEQRHKQALANLVSRLEAVQKLCRHELQTTQGDPSGGSDRTTTCDICGKEID